MQSDFIESWYVFHLIIAKLFKQSQQNKKNDSVVNLIDLTPNVS